MSKKQKPQPQIVNNYNSALAEAKTPSAHEQALSERNKSIIDWSKGGDFRKPPEGVFFDFTNPAIRKENRELLNNTGGQGILALGGEGNSSLLALNKQNMDDHFERDQAEDYQRQVGNTVAGAYAGEGDLMKSDLARRLSIYGTEAGLYNSEQGRVAQANNKPTWWEMLLAGGGQAARTYATAGAGG
jgi:hypothetical protein